MNDTAIKESIRLKDAAKFEWALFEYFKDKRTKDALPMIVEVMLDSWHHRHEDIVSIIQDHKVIGTEDKLYQLALMKFEYLDYDDNFALARKCTWALADIGTVRAQELLIKLGKCENPMICGFANKRIQNWDAEKDRKRA